MKPNFEQMSVTELRAYVLEHRDDIEAIRVLFHHPSLKWKRMPPMFTAEGVPIEENIRLGEEALRQRVEQSQQEAREEAQQQEKELEEKLRQKIEREMEEKLREKIEKEMEEKFRQKLLDEKSRDS